MKNRKVCKLIEIILLVVLIGATTFLTYSLILFNQVKMIYILLGIILVIYISLFTGYLLNRKYRHNKKIGFIIMSIISILVSIAYGIGGYYLTSVFSKLDLFNKNIITYSSSLITFSDKYTELSQIKNTKIGIVKDEEDYELYIIPKEIIDKNELAKENKFIEYNSVVDLMSALYSEEVDLIFVNKNYTDLFSAFEEYSDISEKVKEVGTYSKKVEKIVAEVDKDSTIEDSKLDKPFSVLLLGVDSTADGLNVNAAFNGDTMIIATFNPKTLNATMFSVPRDTYAKIACGNRKYQKINTSAYGGSTCVMNTLKNLTGIDIDYYVKINFKGVVGLVDAVGGVEVDVPYAFCEQNSNRQWGKNTIFVNEPGLQTLNGEQALALARNRHSPGDSKEMKGNCPTLNKGIRNDFVRGQNQQLVIQGLLKKVKDIRSVNKLMEILDIISKNIDTNLSTDKILSLYNVVENLISAGDTDVINIQRTQLRGYDYGSSVWEPTANGYRYIFFHYKGSLNDIVDVMNINLGKKTATMDKKFDFSISKTYSVPVVGNKVYNEAKLPRVPKFSGYSYSQAQSWGSNNNMTIKFFNYDTKEEISDISGMMFMEQSVHEDTMVISAGDTINLYYKTKKVVEEVIPEPETEVNE